MRLFYFILWWLADHELTIALNTGRSPSSIAQLRADVRRWETALQRAQLPPLI
jgi:hypothetical protein